MRNIHNTDSQSCRSDDYIVHFPVIAGGGERIHVIAYDRVSSREQQAAGNLEARKTVYDDAVRPYPNARIICGQREVVSGKANRLNERQALRAAVAAAKENESRTGIRTVILAVDVSRYIRSKHYDARRGYQNPSPSSEEFSELMSIADGVILTTIAPVDAAECDIRSARIKLGQSGKNHRGGAGDHHRPGRKKSRREESMPVAQRVRQAGLSIREISKRLGVPRSTIERWLNSTADACPICEADSSNSGCPVFDAQPNLFADLSSAENAFSDAASGDFSVAADFPPTAANLYRDVDTSTASTLGSFVEPKVDQPTAYDGPDDIHHNNEINDRCIFDSEFWNNIPCIGGENASVASAIKEIDMELLNRHFERIERQLRHQEN